MSHVTEDQFLGALLGTAIGDALGLPVEGLSADEIQETYGEFDGYLEIADAGDGQPISGIISDKTEVVLCIVESLTTNDGFLDPENINARLGFLLRGASRRWLSDATVKGIELAAERDGLVPADFTSEAEASVALRGVPVGMVHALGAWDEPSVRKDAETASRLTHGGEVAVDLTAMVALATSGIARSTREDQIQFPADKRDHPLAKRIGDIIDGVRNARTFEDAVLPVVHGGGEASAFGAIAGGIAGAKFGASGIPQPLIDDLDARIYLSMAAPWFFRTVLRRAGTVIDLRIDTNEFPEPR